MEPHGLTHIKKCTYCKTWDHVSNLYRNPCNHTYRHPECRRVENYNFCQVKKYVPLITPIKQFRHNEIAKCKFCKGYDFEGLIPGYNKPQKRHIVCKRIFSHNYKLMKKLPQPDVCAFTGLPFGKSSETKPNADHDHDTLKFRGHIWASANRLEGAAKFIMNETGWSIDELCDALKTYLTKPGIDIGLKAYPKLGYETVEEAIEHLPNV